MMFDKNIPIEISIWDIPNVKHKGTVYRVINTETVKKGMDYIITDIDSEDYLDIIEEITWDKLFIKGVSDIHDIEGLNFLTFLKELILSHGNITAVKSIKTLINLELLDLSYNKISQVGDLSCLMNLRELYLDNNNIHELDGSRLPQGLEVLSIKGNPDIKLNNFDRLRNLKEFKKE